MSLLNVGIQQQHVGIEVCSDTKLMQDNNEKYDKWENEEIEQILGITT